MTSSAVPRPTTLFVFAPGVGLQELPVIDRLAGFIEVKPVPPLNRGSFAWMLRERPGTVRTVFGVPYGVDRDAVLAAGALLGK